MTAKRRASGATIRVKGRSCLAAFSRTSVAQWEMKLPLLWLTDSSADPNRCVIQRMMIWIASWVWITPRPEVGVGPETCCGLGSECIGKELIT